MGNPLPKNAPQESRVPLSDGTPLFAQIESETLRIAARRIVENWDALSSGWMASREEATEALCRIGEEVRRIRAGRKPDAAPGKIERPLLHHRLSDALRTEVLRTWESRAGDDSVCPPETTLEILSALEKYRVALWPRAEETLATRLAEPDALELVVEVAHDLLSPLNSILFLSEVLRSGHSGPVSDHQRSQLGLVYSATLGMISVVSDVMDLAGEREGVADDEPSVFSVGAVFDSVEEMVRPMAEEKRIALEFRMADRDQCYGHPGQLARVLLNLTTNALKFTEEGSVTVSAETIGPRLTEFSVHDTGRGIAPEEQARLFHPFRKSSNRSGHFFSGSGLGLSIARRLVDSMGSTLELESELGVGTRFFFRLDLPPA
jgi:signal transduction histidine kinase